MTISWTRLAIVRSDPFISAIFASSSSSPSALLFSALSSLARAFIAAFSSAVNPFDCVVFVALICSSFGTIWLYVVARRVVAP